MIEGGYFFGVTSAPSIMRRGIDASKVLLARGLGASHDVNAESAVDYLRGRNFGQLAPSSKVGRFWQGFGGQAVRGQRSATEILSVVGGYTTGEDISMFALEKGMTGSQAGMATLRKGLHPLSIAKRAPGQLMKHARLGLKGSAGFALLDIGLSVAGGEDVWKASVKGTTSAVGGAIGAALTGAAVGSVVPGLGTVAGIIGGMAWGIAGEKIGEAGIGAVEGLSELGRRARRTELGGRASAAMRTRAAATMRQRALQQMNRSGINERSLLSREATLMHLR
jgi:hypothetical protein